MQNNYDASYQSIRWDGIVGACIASKCNDCSRIWRYKESNEYFEGS